MRPVEVERFPGEDERRLDANARRCELAGRQREEAMNSVAAAHVEAENARDRGIENDVGHRAETDVAEDDRLPEQRLGT